MAIHAGRFREHLPRTCSSHIGARRVWQKTDPRDLSTFARGRPRTAFDAHGVMIAQLSGAAAGHDRLSPALSHLFWSVWPRNHGGRIQANNARTGKPGPPASCWLGYAAAAYAPRLRSDAKSRIAEIGRGQARSDKTSSAP
jgi:hypothetical protein